MEIEYKKMSFAEYQNSSGIPQSEIKLLLENPYKWAKGASKKNKSPALEFGSLCHDLLLSPQELENKYIFSDFEKIDLRLKGCKEEKENADKIGLTLIDKETLRKAKSLLNANKELLSDLFNEKKGDFFL